MVKELADKETIISFNPIDKKADIWTYDKRWQEYIEQRMGIKPYLARDGGKDYLVPKSSIKLPHIPRKIKEKTKAQLVKRLEKAREVRRVPKTNKKLT